MTNEKLITEIRLLLEFILQVYSELFKNFEVTIFPDDEQEGLSITVKKREGGENITAFWDAYQLDRSTSCQIVQAITNYMLGSLKDDIEINLLHALKVGYSPELPVKEHEEEMQMKINKYLADKVIINEDET